MVSRGIELTDLPKYHLAEFSTINYQSYSDCQYQGLITNYVSFEPIIQADPASGGHNNERNISDWSFQISSSRMKHRWGLFLGWTLLWVVTASEWTTSNDLFDCRLTGWSTSMAVKFGIPLRAVTITETKSSWLAYSRGDLTQWSADLWLFLIRRIWSCESCLIEDFN